MHKNFEKSINRKVAENDKIKWIWRSKSSSCYRTNSNSNGPVKKDISKGIVKIIWYLIIRNDMALF